MVYYDCLQHNGNIYFIQSVVLKTGIIAVRHVGSAECISQSKVFYIAILLYFCLVKYYLCMYIFNLFFTLSTDLCRLRRLILAVFQLSLFCQCGLS